MSTESETQTEIETQTETQTEPQIRAPLSQIDIHELIKYYEIEIHSPDDLQWYMDRPYYFEQNKYQLMCDKETRRLRNRLNAMKSTGPKTAAGKRKSSQNALKHGFSARRVMLTGEAPAHFKKFERQMLAGLDPVGRIEKMLADRIITLTWRLRRAEWMESAVVNVMRSRKTASQDNSRFSHIAENMPPKIRDMIVSAYHEDCPDRFLAAVEMLPDLINDGTQEPSQETVLGTLALDDFGSSGVLEKLLRYQRQMENSLYKAIAEFDRRQYIRLRTFALAQRAEEERVDQSSFFPKRIR